MLHIKSNFIIFLIHWFKNTFIKVLKTYIINYCIIDVFSN